MRNGIRFATRARASSLRVEMSGLSAIRQFEGPRNLQMQRTAGLTGRTAASRLANVCREWAACEGDPNTLNFNGFRDGQSILKLHTQVPNCAVHLGVTEKKRNSPKVASLPEKIG